MRFDVSPSIGAGHGSRCQALAKALQRHGWETVAACRAPAVPADAMELSGPPEDESAELAARVPQGCELLLIDHYGRDQAFERACRPWARRILAIDDLPDRRHDADVLLDPMPGRRLADLPADTSAQTFLGADFAPLRETFARHRHARQAPKPGSIFVGFGGTDPTGLSRRTLEVLSARQDVGPIIVVLGRHAADGTELMAKYRSHPSVRVEIEPADIAAVMAGCELAIGAGGVSALERCVLGLPSIAVVVAENQRETVDALASRGAVVAMDDPGEAGYAMALLSAVARLRERRNQIGSAAQAVCDGLGAARVAAAVAGPPLRDGSRATFRPVTADDRDALLQWQRLPEIRRRSHNPEPPSTSTHGEWLARKLADPARVFDIAYRDGKPAGVIRLDRDTTSERYKVSIYVLPDSQGMGVGHAMLAFARRAVPWASLVAEVLPDNEVSHRLFRSSGYRGGDGIYVQDPMKDAT